MSEAWPWGAPLTPEDGHIFHILQNSWYLYARSEDLKRGDNIGNWDEKETSWSFFFQSWIYKLYFEEQVGTNLRKDWELTWCRRTVCERVQRSESQRAGGESDTLQRDWKRGQRNRRNRAKMGRQRLALKEVDRPWQESWSFGWQEWTTPKCDMSKSVFWEVHSVSTARDCLEAQIQRSHHSRPGERERNAQNTGIVVQMERKGHERLGGCLSIELDKWFLWWRWEWKQAPW